MEPYLGGSRGSLHHILLDLCPGIRRDTQEVPVGKGNLCLAGTFCPVDVPYVNRGPQGDGRGNVLSRLQSINPSLYVGDLADRGCVYRFRKRKQDNY